MAFQFLSRAALAGAMAIAVALPARAVPLVVDGSLSDWGVTVQDGNVSGAGGSLYNVPINTGTLSDGIIWTAVDEDGNDFSNSYQVTPGYGGQNYDAEFLGLARRDTGSGAELLLAIMSGQRPDNGFSKYSPGDIFIKSPTGVYVIEVGGGAGYGSGGTALGAITGPGGAGTTYTVKTSRYTDSVADATANNAQQTVGSIWQLVDAGGTATGAGKVKRGVFDTGETFLDNAAGDALADIPVPANTDDKTPVQFVANPGQSRVGQVNEYVFTRDATSDTHAIIELSVDLNLFFDSLSPSELDKGISVYWGPSCANDIVTATGTPTSVGEPFTLSLFGAGLVGAGLLRRRRRSA